MKVAYLLYNERLNSSLIKCQVVDLLMYIAKNKEISLTLICIWNPIVYFIHRKDIKLIRNELLSHNVRLESYPVAIFPNRYFTSIYCLLKLLTLYLLILPKIIRLDRFDIVHSRSYLASYISAIPVNRHYKNIFDVRSLLPEENVTINKWSLYSKTYNLWKDIEKFTIESSDSTVVVSKGMKRKICDIKERWEDKVYYIPLLGNAEKLRYNENYRINIRKSLKVDDKFVIVYVGSLGDERILNNIKNYVIYIRQLVEKQNKVFFLFIVPKLEKYYEEIMLSYGIPSNMYRFVEGKNNVAQYLSSADAGINIMAAGHDSSTRFGVKVVEYLLSGLPVLIRNLGGAEEIVEKLDAGLVLCESEKFQEQISVFMKCKYNREKISNQAKELFSLDAVAQNYINLYHDIYL